MLENQLRKLLAASLDLSGSGSYPRPIHCLSPPIHPPYPKLLHSRSSRSSRRCTHWKQGPSMQTSALSQWSIMPGEIFLPSGHVWAHVRRRSRAASSGPASRLTSHLIPASFEGAGGRETYFRKLVAVAGGCEYFAAAIAHPRVCSMTAKHSRCHSIRSGVSL